METVVPSDALKGKTVTGGRVDALRAVKRALGLETSKQGGVDDSDLAGNRAPEFRLESGEVLRPDRMEVGASVPGLALRLTRLVKGIETPVEGVRFKAQLAPNGTFSVLETDSQGRVSAPVCQRGTFKVIVTLESPRYLVTPGNSPYEIDLELQCGRELTAFFEEKSPAGQAIGIWQVVKRAEKKLASAVGLAFWARPIEFEWPAKGDYYSLDRVRITLGHQWDVVGHELGHALYDQARVGVFGGGQHYIDQCYSDALAISEGWASFFSAWIHLDLADPDARFEYMVPRRAPIRVENVPADVCGKSTNEWRVSGFLWDLVDTHQDGEIEATDFAKLWRDTAGARASSARSLKTRLLERGWSPERVQTIWKLNVPGE
jgi:hypothetical protein